MKSSLFILFNLFLLSFGEANGAVKVNLKGVDSEYTQLVQKTSENWLEGKGDFCTENDPVKVPEKSNEYLVFPHFTKSDSLYIGFTMKGRFTETIDNFIKALTDPKSLSIVHYDFDKAEGRWIDPEHFELARVKFVSFFKIKTGHTITYQIVKNKNKAAVIWQLKEKEDIIASDGAFLLEKNSSGGTDFCQLSFYDAKWGPAWLVKKDVWAKSYQGVIREAFSIWIRAGKFETSLDEHKKLVESIVPNRVRYQKEILPKVRPVPKI